QARVRVFDTGLATECFLEPAARIRSGSAAAQRADHLRDDALGRLRVLVREPLDRRPVAPPQNGAAKAQRHERPRQRLMPGELRRHAVGLALASPHQHERVGVEVWSEPTEERLEKAAPAVTHQAQTLEQFTPGRADAVDPGAEAAVAAR